VLVEVEFGNAIGDPVKELEAVGVAVVIVGHRSSFRSITSAIGTARVMLTIPVVTSSSAQSSEPVGVGTIPRC
jgi:hypothetical protein